MRFRHVVALSQRCCRFDPEMLSLRKKNLLSRLTPFSEHFKIPPPPGRTAAAAFSGPWVARSKRPARGGLRSRARHRAPALVALPLRRPARACCGGNARTPARPPPGGGGDPSLWHLLRRRGAFGSFSDEGAACLGVILMRSGAARRWGV